MKFLKDFIILLKARYPIIYISTSEEERIEYLLKYSSKKYISRVCYVWNFVEGYQGNPNNKGLATKNPLETLEFIEKLTPETKALSQGFAYLRTAEPLRQRQCLGGSPTPGLPNP